MTHRSTLCQRTWLFAPRQHGDSSASAGSVGTAHPLYRPRGRVAGAPPGRRQRRSRLYLHSPVVGRDDWDSALPGGTPGEARGVGPPATRPSRALWRLSGATQPLARERHPHPTPAGAGGTGGHEHVAAVELGTVAQAGVCAGDDPLPVLPAGGATDHRHHHAERGNQQDPQPSETGG
jgi:hypothetical protein